MTPHPQSKADQDRHRQAWNDRADNDEELQCSASREDLLGSALQEGLEPDPDCWGKVFVWHFSNSPSGSNCPSQSKEEAKPSDLESVDSL